MKLYQTNLYNAFVETPVEEDERIIHHLHLAKGKEVPEHSADALVTVVSLSGDVSFSAGDYTVRLVPGSFLTMEPNEPHSLLGEKDSHLLVIKQLKY